MWVPNAFDTSCLGSEIPQLGSAYCTFPSCLMDLGQKSGVVRGIAVTARDNQ